MSENVHDGLDGARSDLMFNMHPQILLILLWKLLRERHCDETESKLRKFIVKAQPILIVISYEKGFTALYKT